MRREWQEKLGLAESLVCLGDSKCRDPAATTGEFEFTKTMTMVGTELWSRMKAYLTACKDEDGPITITNAEQTNE